MRTLLISLLLICGSWLSAQEVIITGILDGDLSGAPRAIEIYVNGTVDLTGLTLERYANGASSPNDSYALSGTWTDEFVYIINNGNSPNHQDLFDQAFGSSGDFANRLLGTNIFGNGNDVFTIQSGATILDQTGGTIGDGSNIYSDGYLYRNDNTGPDGGWVAANWQLAPNAVDGEPIGNYGTIVPFGTYSTTPPGPSATVAANGNLSEPATDGGFTVTLSQTASAPVTVSYALAGTATLGADYADPGAGSVTIPAGMLSADISLTVIDDNDSEPSESIDLTLTAISDMTFSLGSGASIFVLDDEPVAAVRIHTIQGSGNSSALVGQDLSIEGIVVADFQGGSGVGLGGFFVQEEDSDADGDPATSEGIWVFDDGAGPDVNVGDKVAVTGRVSEFGNLTQLDLTVGGSSVTIMSSNNTLPTPASLDLPVAAQGDYEAYEGMRVVLIDNVSITNNFGLARFGEFEVSEGERLIQFTECAPPNAAQLATYNAAQDLRRLIVDDGRSGDNNFPIRLPNGTNLTPSNSWRAGAVITGLTGILDERFTGYRLQATGLTSVGGNERPVAAPAVGGAVKVASMNVLNYFTTLGSRGADNIDEFNRQEDKIVAAICALNADIVGLVEIENNGYGANGALAQLVDAISTNCGIDYDFVISPNAGGDQIQVALIYNTAVVEESGTAAALSTPASVFSSNRVPLAQTFRVIQAGNPNLGQQVTVCVNHWKSKGGSCGPGDDDTGGAGSCDGTRTAAASAIAAWMATNPTGVDEPDQLVVGDLNAYRSEDPIETMLGAGFVNTVSGPGFPCGGNGTPSYVFRGEWGSLDYILASSSLAGKVTGAEAWQVNAAEPTALDYDTDFNDPSLYAPDFYRFSDHNPILVGMNLGAALPAELLSFTGEENQGAVALNWATANEVNTDKFEVQRRNENGDFVTIGMVAAAGNSTETINYAFTDATPFTGDNVYRLRILDLDGSEAFSDLITVNVAGTTSVEVLQTGNRQYLLSGAPIGTRYLLTDAKGAVIRAAETRGDLTEIQALDLPAGIYFLLVRMPGQQPVSFKVVLQ
ncbi:ExeM/NucH family extracellular endonuclease [Lewinella sp. W8]|uniref:ExeM/NucH family extracellular endonuclease n=1 Tax=Lewinella sp. W8 TaxID=2528208 RepID=UPI001068727F|nr:ExeM/NucH family extracellular endonuclease [Lewinella sp. W8]MTB50828.1 ExeM/NucH family extracellular endonuclease [Lewinella sp. W8]